MLYFLFTIIPSLVIGFLLYNYQPVLSFNFIDVPLVLGLSCIISYLILNFITKNSNKLVSTSIKGLQYGGISIMLFVIVLVISSFPIFRATDYRNLLGPVTESTDYSKFENVVDIKQVRIVDENMAIRIMDKKLGDLPSIGSQFEIGTPVLQKVKTKLYWVAPLEYNSFFRYLFTNGSPAYVMVSASDPNDAKLVDNLHMKYLDSAYFFSNIQNYSYFLGNMTKGLTDYTFEIDDEGNPYWVVSIYSNQIGFEGQNIEGAMVINAQTGEIKNYTLKNLPEWVDRVQSDKIIKNQIEYWGSYVHWFFNFSNQDRLAPPKSDLRLVYWSDGNCYWYTEISNYSSNQNSINWFMLVNSRTKEAFYYKISGASDLSAMASAEGKVQAMKYKASTPVLYSIQGIPTYIVSLKDNAGLMKNIAFVNVTNYTIVGIWTDVEEALRDYKTELSKSNIGTNLNMENIETITGTISKISSVVENWNTRFYMIVDDKKFVIDITDKTQDIILAKEGDKIKINYDLNNKDNSFYIVNSLN